MKRAVPRTALLLALLPFLTASACDREAATDDVPAAAPAGIAAPLPPAEAERASQPKEIYFDLTRFAWYREGRPLVHDGRSYVPEADPIALDAELKEAGTYEGVTYYVAEGGREPVYTLYVPVYYRYWQRFIAPPGS